MLICLFRAPQTLEATRAAVDGKRPWYEALVLQKREAEASAGQTASEVVTLGVVECFSFVVNAVNVDLLKPVCVGLEKLFGAVEGATDAREELIELLSYCVRVVSIVLNQALLADLPAHIKEALEGVEARIEDINNSGRLFDATGCSLPCRRLRRHARDRAEIDGHKTRLKEIVELATQATIFDLHGHTSEIKSTARATHDIVVGIAQGPPAPEKARVPTSAPPPPKSYVKRTSLLDKVVAVATAADGLDAPHVLFGMGGSGKTALASALVSDDRVLKHFRRGVFWISVGPTYNTKDILERLAARMIVDHAGPVELDSEDAGIQRLTAWARKDPLPRLVVLDDVWESDVVDALQHTGLKLLVTTRVRDVVAAEGGHTDIGDMTKPEARDLLRKQSGAVNIPEAEANTVCAIRRRYPAARTRSNVPFICFR